MIEYITYNKRIDKFTFDDLFPTFIQDLDNWTNENYYGLLLPKDLLRTKDKLKIVLYLEDCIKLFVKKWNECFNK